MDSQLTLVDTAPAPRDTILLVFDRDDLRNTSLRSNGSLFPSYFVDTFDNVTSIYAEDRLLATVTRRKFRRDQITFPGCSPINLGDWLKTPVLSTFPLVFHVFDRRFEWRDNLSGQLVLRDASRPSETLAWFSKSHRGPGDTQAVPRATSLAIRPEIDEVQDMVVLSCMLAGPKLQVSAHQKKAVMYTIISIL